MRAVFIGLSMAQSQISNLPQAEGGLAFLRLLKINEKLITIKVQLVVNMPIQLR